MRKTTYPYTLIVVAVAALYACAQGEQTSPVAPGMDNDTTIQSDASSDMPTDQSGQPDSAVPEDAPVADAPLDVPMDDGSPGDGSEDADVNGDADNEDATDVPSPDTGQQDVPGPDACEPSCQDRTCGDNGCGDVCGVCDDDETCQQGNCQSLYPGLPRVHNLIDAPAQRVIILIEQAIDGLGFTGPDGPQTSDRFVVTRHYIAWIDQSGFYGKMNGLWWLNGLPGDDMDFTSRDTFGRPVNLLIPGEDGRGLWPAGYPGGEHIEFPNQTPEANDDPSCADGDWCNQYSLNEAVNITNPRIPWWSSCNTEGRMAFDEIVTPIEVQTLDAGGLRLIYEGRLVKEADGDGNWDGDACHQDWLFEDRVRRPVYLRVGYELYPDQPWFDRVMQFRNPEGNPPFSGPLSLIGGFVISDWPNPHYTKALHRFVQPLVRDLDDPYHDLVLTAGSWNAWPSEPVGRDIVFGWVRQPFYLSGADAYVSGWTVRMDHVGPGDNDDSGFCLCEVHGAIEIGGGLLHGGISLPIDPGELSIEARRRLRAGGETWLPIDRRTYQAENQLNHGFGRQEGDGWAANTGDDQAGHMIYGPYASDWGDGPMQVVFDMMVDNTTADEFTVVTLDIFDATTQETVAVRPVTRDEFIAPFTHQDFAVEIDMTGRGGHTMETRVFWHDISYVRVDKVTVFGRQ